ncbi:MAG: 4Fe-4S binding protein [Nitrospirae bacterium]|nr:4Fe-4S binding protein [Nitrospirota bacterium]
MKVSQKAYIRKIRYAVQLWFLLFCIYIGYRFFQFVAHFETSGQPFVQRPPSVEGFLPIAGFMSLKYFVFTGIIEPIHPAAMILFVAIVVISLFMKKGFCGWICPIGTISQYLWMAGRRLFGRNFIIKKEIDIPLRAIKYLIMALFLILIGIAMTPNMMILFFITDYYKIVDVRTMKFFTEMSRTTLVVLSALVLLGLLYKNFWCRYLCPYGALLGLVSILSPLKIKRNEEHCMHCRKCSENCPSLIDVEKKTIISSPECYGCLTCVSHCPSEGALGVTMRTNRSRIVVKPVFYIISMLIVFYLFIGIGKFTGHWESKLPYGEYKRLLTPQVKDVLKEQ